MYRALTWAMLHEGVDVDDAAAVAQAASGVQIESGTDPSAPTIHVGAIDVSGPIRGDDVTAAVSAVSAVPRVREQLVALQRAEVDRARSESRGIVVEGRDITTVVLPDADLKVFITADPRVRASRRALQDAGLGKSAVDVAETETALRERDAKDSSRETSPLAQAPDAIVLDTTEMTLNEVIDRFVGLVDGLPQE
jgi:cytidylate kinase